MGDGAVQGELVDFVVTLDFSEGVVVFVGASQCGDRLDASVGASLEIAAGAGQAGGGDGHAVGADHIGAHFVVQGHSACGQGITVGGVALGDGAVQCFFVHHHLGRGVVADRDVVLVACRQAVRITVRVGFELFRCTFFGGTVVSPADVQTVHQIAGVDFDGGGGAGGAGFLNDAAVVFFDFVDDLGF